MIAKKFRLRRWQVKKIMKKNKTVKKELFIIKYVPNNISHHRFSIVLSKKFAKLAVQRNKKRRQIYESIRNALKEEKEMKGHQFFDMILIPKRHILDVSYEKIYQNICSILHYFEKNPA